MMPIGHSKAMWQCKRIDLVEKFVTNAIGAIRWPNLELMQMVSSGGHESSATWWLNLEPMLMLSNFELIQVEPHTIGQKIVFLIFCRKCISPISRQSAKIAPTAYPLPRHQEGWAVLFTSRKCIFFRKYAD